MLTVVRDETILLAERIDIANKVDRLFLLERLAQKVPLASITNEEQKLCALAELLKCASGKYNSESTIANRNINSNVQLYTSYLRQNSTADETLGKELLEIPNLDKKPKSGKITGPSKLKKTESLVLPVRGLNIPFADVVLWDGDRVIVERLEMPLFTVIGLVNKPGNFPYPPDVRYNLVQALAFAGGLDQAAEPRYATVYRLRPDGGIVSATFEVLKKVGNVSTLTDALNAPIKPGDIVDVAHTPRTRTKLFLDRVFRINLGVYVPLYLIDRYE